MKDRLKMLARVGKRQAETFASDDKAQTGMAMTAVSLIVALTVGAIIAAFLLPVGVNELVGVDTSSWSSGASSLWAILDVIVVLAVFLFFISVAMGASNRV